MKMFLKSRIFVAIITACICITGTAYAAGQILASDISYRDGTVESALNDLYTKANSSNSNVGENYDLIWDNSNIHASFEPITISLDLSNYTSVIVMGKYNSSSTYDNYLNYVKINVGSSGTLSVNYSQGDSSTRNIIVRSNEIQFEEGHMWNNNENNESSVPLYIIGVK